MDRDLWTQLGSGGEEKEGGGGAGVSHKGLPDLAGPSAAEIHIGGFVYVV